MKRYLLALLLPFFISNIALAKGHAAKTTLADAAETYYDVKSLKFDLHYADTSVFVTGNVLTTAQVSVASMDRYVFELYSQIIIDSAKINGQLLPVTANGNVQTIQLPSALLQGAVFTAQVYYHGNPPAGGGFFNGVTQAITGGGSNLVYTVSDPYAAQNWWPCKQCIDDKIDSVEMLVTVPQGQVVGSNGVLRHIDMISTPGYWQYQWKTNYPIDYYLISVSIGPYVIDSSYVHFPNGTDSMLVQNFFIDTATFYPSYKSNFDSIGMMIDYFSTLYGRYPFWQEKYGVCYTTLPGGMEHQTMTTIGTPSTYVIAHELTHQWFGDHVTYKYWGHVWLSEGFATYGEQIFINHFQSPAYGKFYRRNQYNNAMSAVGGSVYVTDTSGPNTLFDSRLVYNKGAAVVNMLRFMAPADSLFFKVLRTYQQQYAFGLATTEDLKGMAENIYGVNLDTFFNQWIYGQGYPKYSVTWYQQGTGVYVKLVQTTSMPSSIPLFYTPLELQFNSPQGDTLVRVYNNATTQIFYFDWNKPMDSLEFEPNLWVLCRLNGNKAIHDSTFLSEVNIHSDNVKVFPNPTKTAWQATNIPVGTEMVLMNETGTVLWRSKAANTTMTVPGAGLVPGNYILRLRNGNDTSSIKLSHW